MILPTPPAWISKQHFCLISPLAPCKIYGYLQTFNFYDTYPLDEHGTDKSWSCSDMDLRFAFHVNLQESRKNKASPTKTSTKLTKPGQKEVLIRVCPAIAARVFQSQKLQLFPLSPPCGWVKVARKPIDLASRSSRGKAKGRIGCTVTKVDCLSWARLPKQTWKCQLGAKYHVTLNTP